MPGVEVDLGHAPAPPPRLARGDAEESIEARTLRLAEGGELCLLDLFGMEGPPLCGEPLDDAWPVVCFVPDHQVGIVGEHALEQRRSRARARGQDEHRVLARKRVVLDRGTPCLDHPPVGIGLGLRGSRARRSGRGDAGRQGGVAMALEPLGAGAEAIDVAIEVVEQGGPLGPRDPAVHHRDRDSLPRDPGLGGPEVRFGRKRRDSKPLGKLGPGGRSEGGLVPVLSDLVVQLEPVADEGSLALAASQEEDAGIQFGELVGDRLVSPAGRDPDRGLGGGEIVVVEQGEQSVEACRGSGVAVEEQGAVEGRIEEAWDLVAVRTSRVGMGQAPIEAAHRFGGPDVVGHDRDRASAGMGSGGAGARGRLGSVRLAGRDEEDAFAAHRASSSVVHGQDRRRRSRRSRRAVFRRVRHSGSVRQVRR